MSDLSATDLTGLSALDPTVMPTVLPPDVRAAGKKGEQLYQAALGFEQLLTQSLTDELAKTMQGSDGTSDSSDSGDDGSSDPSTQSIFPSDSSQSSMLGMLLPQTLSDSITRAGGLGVAHQLYLMLAQHEGISTFTGASGGTTGAAVDPASGATAGGAK